MRNPWGHEIYKGDWADSSELWTDDLAEEVGLEIKNDAVIKNNESIVENL